MKEQVSCNCTCHKLIQPECSYCSCKLLSVKEQVSVDELHKKAVSKIMENEKVYVEKEEFDRLKRLDENVKNRIKGLKAVMALNSKTRSYSEDEIAHIDDVIILLESLDK